MSLKKQIDEMSPSELYSFIKKGKCSPNEFIADNGVNLPLIYYLMSKRCSTRAIECLLSKKATINTPVIDWQQWIVSLNLSYIPILLEHGLTINLTDQQCKRVLVEMLITADVSRILALHRHQILKSEQILEALQTPQLIVSALNYMYYQIGKLCKKYRLKSNENLLYQICQIEKQYINFFRLIKNNHLELKDLSNISQVTQMVFNSYLYHLIKYFTDLVDHSTLVNVSFYHFSNFPIINKVVMSPIYNDDNFSRIKFLLREKMFIKKIVKKKLGKKVIKCQEYISGIGNSCQVKVEEQKEDTE